MKFRIAIFRWVFRKAGRWAFVAFVSICLGIDCLAVLHIIDAGGDWYFSAGMVYCVINRLLWQATKEWTEG